MGADNNIMKKSAIWNLLSSIEYSVQSAILLLIVTRVNGLFDAGVFTIAYTLTQMMATIGSYGMRSFQVSDIKKEYTFNTYLGSRVISTVAMIVICMSYAVAQGYDAEKLVLIAWLCGYRAIEGIEDVFHGEMQKSMRLDVAAKIVTIRIFISTMLFGIIYIVTKSLIFSSMILTISALVLSVVMNGAVAGKFSEITLRASWSKTVKLLAVCLPICLSGFLYNYLVNAPKYAIDRNLSEEQQSIFSILFMPIFAINMLSSFIFKPMIAQMGVMWNNGENEKFVKMVIRQLAIIGGMTVTIMFAGALIGIDILGWIYGVDLAHYRLLFTVMLAFGGMAAIVAFLVVVLTIMRKQNYIIVAYGFATIINLIIIDRIVKQYMLDGAGVMYGAAMGIVMTALLAVFIITIHKRKVGESKNA